MRNKQKIYIVLTAVLIACFSAGCDNRYRQLAREAPLISVGVRDGSGTYVRLDDKPLRVVALDPAAAEMAFLLGRGDRLAAVSEFCDSPEEVLQLPTLLIEADSSYSVAAFREAKPDLILHNLEQAWPSPDGFRTFAQSLNAPVFYRSHTDWQQVLDDLHNLGKLLENEEGARNFTDKVRQFAQSLPRTAAAQDSPRVVLVRSVEPLTIVGGGHYLTGLLREAGARNALDFVKEAYAPATGELIAGQQPDLIVILTEDDSRASLLLSDKAPQLAETPAAKKEAIIAAQPKVFLRPGPEFLNAIALLGQHLYPTANLDSLYNAAFGEKTAAPANQK